MRRRDLLVGLAGVATVGGAAWYVQDQPAPAGVSPVTLETLDAPGSEAGEVTVPDPGRISVVTFFATWCHVCEAEMSALASANEALDDVQFVSVTNEPVGHAVTRREISDWWREHDGNWPVALDANLELTEALDVGGVPRLFVFDAAGVLTWQESGRVSAEAIRQAVADVRDGARA